MTHADRDDQVVRAAIEQLRTGDERGGAPSFRAVLAKRSRAAGASWRLSATKPALAAAIVIAAAVLTHRATVGRRDRLTLPREVAALSTWRPLTDVLLETPGRNLLRGTPALGSSIINVNTKGVLR